MFSTRRLRLMALVVLAGCCIAMSCGPAGPADVGVNVASSATVSLADGVSSLPYSRSVTGAVWRIEARDGSSNATLVDDVLGQMKSDGCEIVESIHGHGVSEEGSMESTTTAIHLRCDRAHVEVGWSTGRSTMWMVIGDD